jgi:hypothetical protein
VTLLCGATWRPNPNGPALNAGFSRDSGRAGFHRRTKRTTRRTHLTTQGAQTAYTQGTHGCTHQATHVRPDGILLFRGAVPKVENAVTGVVYRMRAVELTSGEITNEPHGTSPG